jgi:hypothetical protein
MAAPRTPRISSNPSTTGTRSSRRAAWTFYTMPMGDEMFPEWSGDLLIAGLRAGRSCACRSRTAASSRRNASCAASAGSATSRSTQRLGPVCHRCAQWRALHAHAQLKTARRWAGRSRFSGANGLSCSRSRTRRSQRRTFVAVGADPYIDPPVQRGRVAKVQLRRQVPAAVVVEMPLAIGITHQKRSCRSRVHLDLQPPVAAPCRSGTW